MILQKDKTRWKWKLGKCKADAHVSASVTHFLGKCFALENANNRTKPATATLVTSIHFGTKYSMIVKAITMCKGTGFTNDGNMATKSYLCT